MRMPYLKFTCMQKHSVTIKLLSYENIVFASTVLCISQNMVRYMFHMTTELMFSSSHRIKFYKRITGFIVFSYCKVKFNRRYSLILRSSFLRLCRCRTILVCDFIKLNCESMFYYATLLYITADNRNIAFFAL